MEYSEEEKKAIEDLKLQIKQDEQELPYSEESLKYKKALLNLMDRLKRDNKKLDIENQKLFEDTIENYISKDVIREKIKELKEIPSFGIFQSKEPIIRVLKELLGE